MIRVLIVHFILWTVYCVFHIVCFIFYHMPILFILYFRIFYQSSFLAAIVVINACLVSKNSTELDKKSPVTEQLAIFVQSSWVSRVITAADSTPLNCPVQWPQYPVVTQLNSWAELCWVGSGPLILASRDISPTETNEVNNFTWYVSRRSDISK